MKLNQLNYLYRQVILDHAKNPRNKREVDHPSFQMELLNPSCGDVIVVQGRLKDGLIEDIGFDGYGCSISLASASMMTDVLKGQTIEEALHLIEAVDGLVSHQETPLDEKTQAALKDTLLLEGVKQFPARYKCATLAWKACELALNEPVEELRSSELDLKQEEQEE